MWGWNGSGPASAAWLYSGFGSSRWSESTNGWHDSPVSYGELSRLQLELPAGGTRSVSTVKLDAYGAAVWLSDTPAGDELSPSLAWFAELARLSVGLVSTSRIAPVVVEEGPFTVARWRPVVEPRLQLDIDALAAAAPPVCRNGSVASTNAILVSLVDGVARSLLGQQGWRPELGRKRAARVQALRAVFTALSSPDAVIRSGSDDFADALVDITRSLDRHQRRLAGKPVVRHRLRLTIPEDPGDPWDISLELVSESDPGQWCSADDVWARNVRATDVAGGEQHIGLLEAEITALVEAIAPVVPGLADLASAHEPTGVELELELAEDFLDRAPHELHQLGIELIGPEHLVTAKVAIRGVATPSQPDDRRKRFGLEALVEWNAVIDDTPIDPADLERAEAAGATLLHIGHRWVKIDPAGLRRARAVLDDHRRNHASVSPLDLLKFASPTDDDAPFIGVAGELSGDLDDHAGEFGDDQNIAPIDTAWVRDLLAGLPDERLEEVREPDGFVGELRHYQRRGLAWLQFLGRLGLGGCLADDMGLGKTATTLAHLVTLPGPHLVVCPLSVVHNWEAEAARFTPGLEVLVHHGASRQRGEPALFGLADADVVVTTYGLMARDIEALEVIDWTTVVLDEAQMVKNSSTRAAKAVRRLSAGQKLALTGTPVENRLAELWSILDAVNPGYLGSQTHFREHYATPIERRQDADVAQRLRTLTQPFVLRRTKADKRLLPGSARQDRADRLCAAHQGAGDAVPAHRRRSPEGR